MPIDSEVIISDTSCLILLSKIDKLDLLKKFSDSIYVTPDIKSEFGNELPDWIKVKAPKNKAYQELLELDLDAGESSAISLTFELENSILILDDLKGRYLAEKLKLRFSGTFGLILKAKQLGIIDKVKPILDEIKQTNFRFSEKLFELVLKEAGE
ncbi:MAG: DUF3368 domain-containing protein [Bacteroidetes bacterium]|nr:MAG: DUF3368 domain-containing protein [Bacteroidota bacterium]